jgi:hypothetical protein
MTENSKKVESSNRNNSGGRFERGFSLMSKDITWDEFRGKFVECREMDIQRFLDQAEGSSKIAMKNFDAHLKWRASLPSMAEMRTQAEVELKKGKVYVHGKTKSGLPIMWWETGRNDPKVRDIEVATTAALYVALHMEQELDATLVDGKPGKFCFVVDRVNNVTDLPLVLKIVKSFQENFPERLGVCFIVPAPFIYRATFNVVKPFLSEKTRSATKMLSNCSELQQYIDLEHIPTRMEGKDPFKFDEAKDIPTASEWRHLYGLDAAAAVAVQSV